MAAKLYLIPTPISESRPWQDVTPPYNVEVISSLDYFVVENLRTARRYLSSLKCGIVIDDMLFTELSEHTPAEEVDAMVKPILEGRSAGILSEAGVPGVADPGSDLVAAAHRHGIEVVPLVGPSSILMALMASGMNGQNFTFNGYLPVKPDQRRRALRELERGASRGTSQIFIETPYRNDAMFQDICATVSPEITLTLAVDITSSDQFIKSYKVKQWRGMQPPQMKRRPTIFILGR